jgi:hypothetical protein
MQPGGVARYDDGLPDPCTRPVDTAEALTGQLGVIDDAERVGELQGVRQRKRDTEGAHGRRLRQGRVGGCK